MDHLSITLIDNINKKVIITSSKGDILVVLEKL
jgi:hypothetical protein